MSGAELQHYEEVIKPREELQKRKEMEEHERRMQWLRKNPPQLFSKGVGNPRMAKS